MGSAQKYFEQPLIVAANQSRPQQMIVAAPAEALLAKIIGHAARLENLNQRRKLHHISGDHVADFDGESISGQMSEAQLVAMPGGPERLDVGQFQLHDSFFG